MGGEWGQAPLLELYESSSGLSKPRSAFGSGYPFLSFKDVFYDTFVPDELSELVNSTERERERCSVKRGDVFLTRTSETFDELGMSCVALRDIPDATFNGFTKRLRPRDDERIVPEYAAYYFRSPTFRHAVTAMSSMSTRASLNNEMLGRLSIPLPPLDEQVAIGQILGTLDAKIELNRRTNGTLEAVARALFRSWFVDFDPVRAKSEGRDPGLPPHIADLFPASFEDSELGEIPMGWSPTRIGDIAELAIGGDWGADSPTPKQPVAVRCLRGVDLHSLRTTGRSEVPLRFVSEDSLHKRLPAPVDVIVEGSGECGRSLAFGAAVANVFGEPVVYSNFCKRIRSRSPAHAVFVEWILNELVANGEMKNYVTGTAMPNLDLKGLLVGLTVVMAPMPILAEFAKDAELARSRRLAPESRTLAALRDTVLPKLISGELRLDGARRGAEGSVP